jgi:hypothetical protein
VTELVPTNQDDSANLLAVISRAASDPNVDVDKMERLFALRERMAEKEAEAAFNGAMMRVQAKMGRISADATNPQTRSNYATYGKLDKALRPIYTTEGLSLSFGTEPAPDGYVGMVCFVSHTGGHTRTYTAQVPSDGKGAKGNDVMTKTHAFGSGTSYGMRYLLKMIFNVAIGEEDDDGNGSTQEAYDISAWAEVIRDAADKTELDRIGADLKSKTGIPAAALRNIRGLWAAKAKEFAP